MGGIYERVREHLRRRRKKIGKAETIQIQTFASAVVSAGTGGPPPGVGPGIQVGPRAEVIVPIQGVPSGVEVMAAVAAAGALAVPGPSPITEWAELIRVASPGVLVDEHFDVDAGVMTLVGSWFYGASNAISASSAAMYWAGGTPTNKTAELTLSGFDQLRLYARSSLTTGLFSGSVVCVDVPSVSELVLREAVGGSVIGEVSYVGGWSSGDVLGLSLKGTAATMTLNGAPIGSLVLTAATGPGWWGWRTLASSVRGADRYRLL